MLQLILQRREALGDLLTLLGFLWVGLLGDGPVNIIDSTGLGRLCQLHFGVSLWLEATRTRMTGQRSLAE